MNTGSSGFHIASRGHRLVQETLAGYSTRYGSYGRGFCFCSLFLHSCVFFCSHFLDLVSYCLWRCFVAAMFWIVIEMIRLAALVDASMHGWRSRIGTHIHRYHFYGILDGLVGCTAFVLMHTYTHTRIDRQYRKSNRNEQIQVSSNINDIGSA